MIGRASVAAATAVANYDILRDVIWKVANHPRVIRRIGVVGSAVINDCSAVLYVGSTRVAELSPTTIGVVAPKEDDMIDMAQVVPAGAEVSLLMSVGATTNPVTVRFEFIP